MSIPKALYRQLIRGLHSLQRQPPDPPRLDIIHLDAAVLVVDRVELLRRLPAGGIVMECGVDEAKLSRQIVQISNPTQLILVDTWATRRFNSSKLEMIQREFTEEISRGNVRIARMTSLDALRATADESLDWIYIDTDHSYSTTRDELLLAAQKVKRNGYICGHDYTLGSWPSYHRYGVIEAVNAFCVEHHWRFAFLTHEPNRNLSFALRRIGN
jgi:hypothetical protein